MYEVFKNWMFLNYDKVYEDTNGNLDVVFKIGVHQGITITLFDDCVVFDQFLGADIDKPFYFSSPTFFDDLKATIDRNIIIVDALLDSFDKIYHTKINHQ